MTKNEAQFEIHGTYLPKDILDEDGYMVSYPNGLKTWYNKESFLKKAFPIESDELIAKDDITRFYKTSTYHCSDTVQVGSFLNMVLKWTRGTLFRQ